MMATNKKYAEAFDAYDKARRALEETQERHRAELTAAVAEEKKALRLMVEVRDDPENWV